VRERGLALTERDNGAIADPEAFHATAASSRRQDSPGAGVQPRTHRVPGRIFMGGLVGGGAATTDLTADFATARV